MQHNRILIIDDNAAIHTDYRKILAPEEDTNDAASLFLGKPTDRSTNCPPKFELTSAYQGKEGVAIAAEAASANEPFSVVFVDMRMPPGQNGLQTIQELWEVDPDLQIVICSAYSDHSWNDIHTVLGDTDKLLILKKPFDSAEVSQLAVALSAKWRLTHEARKVAEEKSQRLQWAEDSLSKHNRHLEMATSLAGLGYCSLDLTSGTLTSDQRTHQILGTDPSTAKTLNQLFSNLDRGEQSRMKALFEEASGQENYSEHKTSFTRGDGEQGHVQVRVISESDISGNESVFGIFLDVTENENALNAVRHASLHDPLTGLPNRAKFLHDLDAALKRTNRNGRGTALVLVDIDHFKSVNDTHGHPVGDSLIQEVARRLQQATREVDTVARLGGDEFAIVQDSSMNPEGTNAMLSRVYDLFRSSLSIDGLNVPTSISAGIALAPNNGNEVEALIRAADCALYRAKQEGRGVYRFFDQAMDERIQIRQQLERDLLDALDNEELAIYFQPIVSTNDKRIIGLEALLRWFHPKLGMVSPDEFVPIAEDTGSIIQIGEFVLEQACLNATQWSAPLRLSVNVSAAQLKKSDFLQSVERALAISRMEPTRLELEITETVLLNATSETISTLHTLRDRGVRIAMDDFGIGYSSLSYLQRFPFDKLKLDRSFLLDSGVTEESKAIIGAVSALGRNLGIQTCAEGVETREQFEIVRDEGYTQVQGYLFGKPVDAAAIAHRISQELPNDSSHEAQAGNNDASANKQVVL